MKQNGKVIFWCVLALVIMIMSFIVIGRAETVSDDYIEFSFETNQFDRKVLASLPQILISVKDRGDTAQIVVRSKDTVNHFTSQRFSQYREGMEKFLRKTSFIDFDSEEVVNLSNQLNLSELSPLDCAKTVLNTINQNAGLIQFDEELVDKIICGESLGYSASETLRRRKGTCGEFTNVFIALMRLNKIPCKYICGFYLNPEHQTLHAWAEFYDKNLGWVPVDPQNGMLGVSPYHIKRLEGKDFQDTGSDFSKLLVGNFKIIKTMENHP